MSFRLGFRFPGFLKDIIICLLIVVPVITLILLTGLISIWRGLVILLARAFRRNSLGEILGPAELILVSLDPGIFSLPQQILPICVTLKGRVDPSSFKENLMTKVLNVRSPNGRVTYERLQQHVTYWLGYAFFEWDTDFRIDEHVQVIPNSDLWGETEDERTASLIALLENETFDRGSAIWNVSLVPGFMNEDRTLVYLKFHHTIGDGLSIMKLLLSRMAEGPGTATAPPTAKPVVQKSKKTALGVLRNFYGNTFGLPRRLYEESGALHDLPARQRTPSPKRFITTTKAVPLGHFKELKRSRQVPFTNAVHACLSAAMSKYIEKHEAKVEPLEYLTGTSIFPLPGHPDNRLANYYGLVSVNLPLSLQSWSMDKVLGQCKEELELSGTLKSPMAYALIGRGISYYPSKWGHAFFRRLVAPAFFISNMPGPSRPISLFGHEMQTMMFYITHKYAPWFNVSIMSYNGSVRIGLTGSSQVIKGQEVLEEIRADFEMALDGLLYTCIV